MSADQECSSEARGLTLPSSNFCKTLGRSITRFHRGLPPSRGHSIVLVIVDRFSKGVHLGSLPAQHTAFEVAQLFMEICGKIHGPPRSLVSDRDPLFLSRFWRELFMLSGTTLKMSTAYHPQTDDQTEVMSRVIEQYLREFVHRKLTTWRRFLMWAEWSYNTSSHSATGMSPYEIKFGKKPPHFPQYLAGVSNVEAVDTWISYSSPIIPHRSPRPGPLPYPKTLKTISPSSPLLRYSTLSGKASETTNSSLSWFSGQVSYRKTPLGNHGHYCRLLTTLRTRLFCMRRGMIQLKT